MRNMKNTRKKAAGILIAAILALMSILPAAALAEQTGTVFGGWLILRSSPSFSGAIKSSYPTGTKVTITGQTGSWYAVKTPDGLTGYMLGSYLKISGTTPSSGTTAWVTSANGLNVRLRTGPGTGYTILATYSPGTECTVITSGTNWSKISIGTYTGYMMSRYLTNVKPGTDPAPTTPPSGSEYDVWVTSANGKGVNLRSGPSKSYSSIGFYGVGTAARMVYPGTQWSYIRVGTRYGYMMTEFLTTTKPSGPSPIIPVVSGAYVISGNGKSVNLRTGPGKQYKVLASYKVGTPLVIITRGTEWYFIHIGNEYGYMMKTFINETGSATQTDI
ncbi:MAG: SH3 domain-containing protein [Clostridiales bacterium]|nr:SH3 domain-containing protein [Clostridiales bacterium]